MSNYEYTTILIDTSAHTTITRTLNDMGRNGWELVSVTADRQYIFKRAKAAEFVIGPSETKAKGGPDTGRRGTGPLSEAMARAQERKAHHER